MHRLRHLLSRAHLRHLLLVFLAVFGALPILLSTLFHVRTSRNLLEMEEQLNLSRQAELVSSRLSAQLDVVRERLDQMAVGLDTVPAASEPNYLMRAKDASRGGGYFRGVDRVSGQALETKALAEVNALADQAREAGEDLMFAETHNGELWLIVSRLAGGRDHDRWVLQELVQIDSLLSPGQEVFLLDRTTGDVVWADRAQEAPVRKAVAANKEVREFLSQAAASYGVLRYTLPVGASQREMIGQIGPIGDTRWALLVQKPREAALLSARNMVKSVAIIAALTVLGALAVAAVASRLISQPIQNLADSAREISSGRFGQRVPNEGFGHEMTELAASFNNMSEQVADHVQRLRRAAQVNRELFLGTLRSMLAAVEAKEPYTRGHSERVANYSRAVARRLGSERELQEQAWIAGLLHDVGKIGIEDRILNKGDVLTEEEFEAMKRHPVIGAEIMSAIEPLRAIVPAIRSHHERWAGGGYPDGLHGADIPVLARVIAVADTFDALTTQRVYQDPYPPDQALDVIRSLESKNFEPRVVQAFFAAYDAGEISLAASGPSLKAEPVAASSKLVVT